MRRKHRVVPPEPPAPPPSAEPSPPSTQAIEVSFPVRERAPAMPTVSVGGNTGTRAPLEPGSRLGRCLVTGELGRGANSAVFRGLHGTLNVPVALKVLDLSNGDDDDTLKLFAHEARILARLDHPAIVRVLDFDPEMPYPHLVLECVDGLSLKELLQHTGAVRPPAMLHMLEQIARGLDHAAGLGVIHRDIKPGNILLSRTGGVKIADLGLAKVTGGGAPRIEARGDSVGTPAYISPEQVLGLGRVDFRSDLYSLGATAYHALTGRLPFETLDLDELMKAHVQQRPTPPCEVLPSIPEALSDLVMRMMSKQPQDRFASYTDLIAAINEVATDTSQSSDAARRGKPRGGIRGLFGG